VSELIKCLGGEEFSEGLKFFIQRPIVLSYVQNIFPGGQEIFVHPLFTGVLIWGANCAPVPAPSSPDKAISAISVKRPLHKGKRWHSTAG